MSQPEFQRRTPIFSRGGQMKTQKELQPWEEWTIRHDAERFEGLQGGQVIWHCLKELGVEKVFGYSGGAVLPLLDAFHSNQINFIMNRHEQCSGHAAEGYAKSSGRPGVVVVTSGPGITNVVTPFLDALNDGVPMVVFSGQVPTSAVGTDAFQEAPAVDITKPATKWSYVLRSIEEIPYVVERAFQIAMSGRKGPVHIDVPKDISGGYYDVSRKRETYPHLPSLPIVPSELSQMYKVEQFIELLSVARKPVLYVGQGAIDCAEEVREFAERWNIPVTTTLHAMGIFDEQHPLSMQMVGMHGSAGANFAVQQCDLLIGLGSRFDDRTTGVVSAYAPEAKKAEALGTGGIVHFDIHPRQIGKVVNPTLAFLGDCKKYLRAILEVEAPAFSKSNNEWVKHCQDLQKQHPFRVPPTNKPDGLNPQMVLTEINKATSNKEDYMFTTGVGSHQMHTCQFITWRHPRTIISSGSLGTMGVSTPYSVGVAVANPNKTVISIDGDGSFMMTAVDLMTIVEHNLNIKICIMNDKEQNMVTNWQTLYCDGRVTASLNLNPNFQKLAEACGMKGLTIRTQDELQDKIQEMLEYEGPVLCDFEVDPSMCIPFVFPGKPLDCMLLYEERFGENRKAFEVTGEAPS